MLLIKKGFNSFNPHYALENLLQLETASKYITLLCFSN